MRPPLASLRRPFLAWLALGLVAAVSGRTTTRDVEYGSAGAERLRLDVSVPEGDGPFPVVVLVHGGGWSGGDKAGGDIAPWFDLFNQAGVVWFSINYRLAPAYRWPAQIEDVRTALRWIKANAARYHGDATRIALVGHSAGGHLAFLAATENDPTTAVRAVVGYAPVTDFEQELPVRGGLSKSLRDLHDRPHELTADSLALLRETAPLNRLAPGAPPFLIVHGDRDRTVPLQQSLNFQARARATGNTCDLHTIPGAGHRLGNWSDLDPAYYQRILRWLDARFAERSAPATSAPRPVPAVAPSAPVAAAPAQRPAAVWTEAFPLGGARLRAMVFGGTAEERIQLNEDTLWPADAAGPAPEIPNTPLGDVLLSFPGHEVVSDYRRHLDPERGLATLSYRPDDGAAFERITFVSRPDRALVQKLSTDRPGTLSFNVYASSPHAASQARPVDARTWMLSGRVGFDRTRFVCAIRVVAEGAQVRVEATPTGLRITGADQAVMLVTAATSYVAPGDLSGAPETTALNHLDAASERTAASLLERHLADVAKRYPSSGPTAEGAFAAYLEAAAGSNPDTALFWASSWNERLDSVAPGSTGVSALLAVHPLERRP